jgi:hypothetical protein
MVIFAKELESKLRYEKGVTVGLPIIAPYEKSRRL